MDIIFIENGLKYWWFVKNNEETFHSQRWQWLTQTLQNQQRQTRQRTYWSLEVTLLTIFPSQFKSNKYFVLCKFQSSDFYKIWHMTWKLCRCDMCKYWCIYRWVSAKKKNVTPLLMHWSYVRLALTHQYTGMSPGLSVLTFLIAQSHLVIKWYHITHYCVQNTMTKVEHRSDF